MTPWVRFSEGFASSWKEKNISFTVGDGTGSIGGRGNANYNTQTLGFNCANAYCYNGSRNYPLDIPQNVPGAVYNTETGFSYPALTGGVYGPPPNPNPPLGFQFNADIIGGSVPNQGNPFSDDWAGSANATGIANAGIANQGTRLYLSFGNIPAGASLWLAPVIYLFRQGVAHNGDPATLGANPLTGAGQAQSTGVMVLVNTDGAGANLGPWSRSQPINQFQLTKVGASNLGVYEILYTDPYSVEYADVPVVLAYASNPGQNLPAPRLRIRTRRSLAASLRSIRAQLPRSLRPTIRSRARRCRFRASSRALRSTSSTSRSAPAMCCSPSWLMLLATIRV